MKRSISLDILPIVMEVTQSLKEFLKIEPGWYYCSNATPTFKKGHPYFFLSHATGIKQLGNDQEGFLDIESINSTGYILDDKLNYVCFYSPKVFGGMSTVPVSPSSAFELVDAMISDMVCRMSKDTVLSLKVRDFEKCFDFDTIRQKIEKDQGLDKVTIGNDQVRAVIDHLVADLYSRLDPFFLQIIHFINLSAPGSVYSVIRSSGTCLISEAPARPIHHWDTWSKYGILQDVLDFANQKIKEKDSEVSLQIYKP